MPKENYREKHATDASQDVPLVAVRIFTLQEAVRASWLMNNDSSQPIPSDVVSKPEGASLRAGSLDDGCLFAYARALKAYESTVCYRLTSEELEAAFSLWWDVSKPYLVPDADFDEYRLIFHAAWKRARSPLGANQLQQAIRLAASAPPPPEASRYGNPQLQRLVAVCFHLQRLQGDSPFFLSLREAAKVLRTKSLHKASAILHGLVHDGILVVVEKGTRHGRRATRFKFKSFETNSATCASASSE